MLIAHHCFVAARQHNQHFYDTIVALFVNITKTFIDKLKYFLDTKELSKLLNCEQKIMTLL